MAFRNVIIVEVISEKPLHLHNLNDLGYAEEGGCRVKWSPTTLNEPQGAPTLEEYVVNIDGLSIDPEEVEAYADGLAIVEVAPEEHTTRCQLVDYARQKANAMRLRLSGDIDLALCVERHMEWIYKQLPASARW